jgi:hypothetical protein
MKCKVFLTVIFLCLFSCTFEEDGGYYDDAFGVVKSSTDNKNGLYIEGDDGTILIPDQSVSSFVSRGDRVWVSYAFEEKVPKPDTLIISPYRITRIVPMTIQPVTNLKNDGIDLWTVWVAQNFLTFDFRIRAKDPDKLKDHKYALVSPQKEIGDTLSIEFLHDAGNDLYGVLCRTAMTLKLDELTLAKDSTVIAVTYINLSGTKQTEYCVYKKDSKTNKILTYSYPQIKNNNRDNLK